MQSSRDLRQNQCVDKYFNVLKDRSKKGATIMAATGFGKSRMAISIAKRFRVKFDDLIIIVVPTKQLKKQWEGHVLDNKIKNAVVTIINTVALKNDKYNCGLLILDELHLYAAEKFSKVFKLINYRYILGLTATMERLDGREELLKQYAPICDVVTQQEAKRNGWISNFFEFNLSIELDEKTQKELDEINGLNNKYLAWFNWDFTMAKNCLVLPNAINYAQKIGSDIGMVINYATQLMVVIRKRKDLLYNYPAKVDAAIEVIKNVPVKTITFAQSIEIANRITKAFPVESLNYHSKMKANDSEMAFKLFSSNKIRIINTAKALNQGTDVPDIELGIITSQTSSYASHTQITGRCARVHIKEDGSLKQSCVVNIYIKGSQEAVWLKSAQKNSAKGIINVSSVNDLISQLNKIYSL